MRSLRWALLLALALVLSAIAGCSCGSSANNGTFPPGPDGGNPRDGMILGGDTSLLGEGAVFTIVISPANKVVDVTFGQPPPTVSYTATVDGQPVAASWSVDRGEIGSIDASSGVFTPGGMLGGKANITASYGGQTASTSVTVILHMTQNGDPNAGNVDGGAGGVGGVGGEGPGGAVTPGQQMTLQGQPMSDPAIGWLYPYDQTVWPRGILAPLLQWTAGTHSFDAVFIHISEASFDYQGFFAKTATPFIHHPVEQAAWQAMAYSNAGEPVTVTLVFSEGTTAWGPITETWKIAQGTLKGTVYYNSYGTNLAHNYCCTLGGATFGAATLAIKGGSTDPTLVAGNDTECRVCHSVAASGSVLVTQQGESMNDWGSSAYDLKNGNTETPMNPQDGRFSWPALYPDGTFLFSNSAPSPFTNGPPPAMQGATSMPSALYAVPSGSSIAATGLPSGLQAACPAFSPDGKHVAFNFFGGPGADGKSLALMDFTQSANAFSNLGTLFTPGMGTVVWPSFLPTNDAVVFELEVANDGRDFGGTRSTCDGSGACSDTGSQGELWWIDSATKTATRLDQANGLGYVPSGPNGHGGDATLSFEPTVNPVPSGGYAWVVFTSRRMYGNVATINPYWSDPRYHDLSQTPTPKKLWVAAIDLNAKAGTDPSHPAFYLPGQELLAGNSRGFWVVDPCKMDGQSCQTGDECCGGYCRQAPDGGGLECSSQMMGCAQEFDKCTMDSDCCGNAQGIKCINGRCAQQTPQ